MLKPQPITTKNCHLLKKYLKYMDKHKALTYPTVLCLWKDYLGLEMCEEDNFLFLFEKKFNYVAYPPYGDGDVEVALQKVKEYIVSKFEDYKVICLNEEQKNIYEKLGYKIEEDIDHNEYVYLSDDLAYLKGKKYHKKRNHINKFKRQYNYVYERITKENFEEVKLFLESWYLENKDKMTLELKHEKQAILNFIEFLVEINYKGAIIKIDNQIVAFTAGEKIADDMAVIYFEKALDKYNGAYQVINNEFILNDFLNVKYINRQEDLGIEGLRKSKKSYYPAFQVKNYNMVY